MQPKNEEETSSIEYGLTLTRLLQSAAGFSTDRYKKVLSLVYIYFILNDIKMTVFS